MEAPDLQNQNQITLLTTKNLEAVNFFKFKLLEIIFNDKLHIFLKDWLLYLKFSIFKVEQSQTNQSYMKKSF